MTDYGEIGLRRGTVKLVSHDPRWTELFNEEKELLLRTLGKKLVDVRHIGSTSIAGMPAKPIIDIVAAVHSLADVESFAAELEMIGYLDKGAGGVVGRRFFVKGGEARRTHHLNFCEMNSFFWESHLAFCDHLGQHPEIAQEYAALKRRLADQYPKDRLAYTSGKEEFVRSVLEGTMKKNRWSGSI